jgi:MFS family permease
VSPTFRALRIRNYRLYATGAVVSNVGTWMQRVAQDWLVLELTHSGTALGIVTALQFMPALVVSPYAGLLADRFAKRRVLLITQLSMAVVSLVLGVLATAGAAQIWQVYLLALLFGIATAFDAPARQSFVVEMVGPDDLSNAVGLNGASFNTARVIGPALAGVLIAWFGTGPVILANALSYGAVIASLLLLRGSELHTPPRAERSRGMIRDGVRYLWRRPELMMVVTTVFFVGMFGLNFQLTSALMATKEFGKGSQGFGILASIFALGSLAGALLAARRARPRIRIVIGGAIAFGLIEIAAGLMPTYLTYVLVLPVMGLAAMTMLNTANATVQLTVAPTMRGRVMALYMAMLMGSTTVGSPFIGWIGQTFGARWTLIVGGGMTMLGTLAAVLYYSRKQGLSIRPHLRPRPRLDVLPVDPLDPGGTTARAA